MAFSDGEKKRSSCRTLLFLSSIVLRARNSNRAGMLRDHPLAAAPRCTTIIFKKTNTTRWYGELTTCLLSHTNLSIFCMQTKSYAQQILVQRSSSTPQTNMEHFLNTSLLRMDPADARPEASRYPRHKTFDVNAVVPGAQ